MDSWSINPNPNPYWYRVNYTLMYWYKNIGSVSVLSSQSPISFPLLPSPLTLSLTCLSPLFSPDPFLFPFFPFPPLSSLLSYTFFCSTLFPSSSLSSLIAFPHLSSPLIWSLFLSWPFTSSILYPLFSMLWTTFRAGSIPKIYIIIIQNIQGKSK